MKKRSLLLCMLSVLGFVFISGAGYAATAPDIEWQKSLGGSGSDGTYCTYSIQQTSDGGYIVAGWSASKDGDVTGNHGDSDYWIVKLDSTGGIVWQKSLGGSMGDSTYSIQQTSDGGYIVAGWSASNDGDVTGNHGDNDYWIVKLDSTGGIVWQKSLGGSSRDYATSIQQTSDGGYIVAGLSSSKDGDVTGNHGYSDYWIVKLDSTGGIVWQKSLGGSGYDEAFSIQQTSDGGYIVAGRSNSNDGDVTDHHGDNDYWIVRLNSTGGIVWQKSLDWAGSDAGYSIQQTSDGGYIVAGDSFRPYYSNRGDISGYHGLSDYWIVKLDSTGDIVWQKSLGGSGIDRAFSIQQTSDGGYVVAGESDSNDGDVTGNHGDNDYWIVRLNSTGGIVWQKSLGGSGYDVTHSIQQTSDGGYIVAGYSNSNDGDVTGNHGNYDYWIVKLAPDESGGGYSFTVDTSGLGLQNNALTITPGAAVNLSVKSNPSGASFTAIGLPVGLYLSSQGVLSGQTSIEGTYKVTITGSLNGAQRNVSFSLKVDNGDPVSDADDLMLSAVFSKIAYDRNLAAYKGVNIKGYVKDTSWSDVGKPIWNTTPDITYGKWFSDSASDSWVIKDTFDRPSSGMFAAAFDSADGKRRIIAYRGTELNPNFSSPDVWADLALSAGSANSQLEDAIEAYKNLTKDAMGRKILVTGHSLGGALAGYVSILNDVEAVSINGATGYAIDAAYSKNVNLALTFTGTEAWKFENHITNDVMGLNTNPLYDTLNLTVTGLNKNNHDTFEHTTLAPGLLAETKNHAATSFLAYDSKKFKMTSKTPVGHKGGVKDIHHNFPPIFKLYLGSSTDDVLDSNSNPIDSRVYAYGGGGDDNIWGSFYGDDLVGGSGDNHLEGFEGSDVYVITDGDYTINDPSGSSKIMLLGDAKINGPIIDDGDYYKAPLPKGHYIRVNKKRDVSSGALTVVDENGKELGEFKSGASFQSLGKIAAVYPTSKYLLVEGTVTLSVYDKNGVLKEKFSNNAKSNAYRDFGYFYMRTGAKPTITAALINGNYNLRIEGNSAAKYTIINFNDQDEPTTQLAVNVPLTLGVYLDTQSDFGANNVPFVIRDSLTGAEISRLTPIVTNLTEEKEPGVKETFTVTFDSQGGSAVAPINNVQSGAMIKYPVAPTLSGYSFRGWYKEASCINMWHFPIDVVTANTTLYAKWTPGTSIDTFTVTFNSQGGSAVTPISSAQYGAIIKTPTPPTRPNHTFGGWYKEASYTNAWDFSTDVVTADITLYAKWTANSTSSESGGGCSVGLGAIGLLLAIIVANKKTRG
ncbi:hypothetical protein AGMMS50276_10670 [Synergistales bacterium]|nr:hypothetical protein AGMMS50276_10670 [Synergistales bacterium]